MLGGRWGHEKKTYFWRAVFNWRLSRPAHCFVDGAPLLLYYTFMHGHAWPIKLERAIVAISMRSDPGTRSVPQKKPKHHDRHRRHRHLPSDHGARYYIHYFVDAKAGRGRRTALAPLIISGGRVRVRLGHGTERR